MEEALRLINQVAASADEQTRQALVVNLRKLADSMEHKFETLHRFGHLYLEQGMIEVGLDLGLFEFFAEARGPKTVEEAAQQTGCDPQLMKRILRYYNTLNIIEETENGYIGSNRAKNLNEKVTKAALGHYYGVCKRQYSAYASFLKETGYKNPEDETYTAFNKGHDTKLSAFQWLAGDAQELEYLNTYMGLRCQVEQSWLDVYPTQKEIEGLNDPDRALFVNISGGNGHRCAQFLEAFPDTVGRIILEDYPFLTAGALPISRMEVIAHNVLDPQPIKGAKFYYMRSVPHIQSSQNIKKLLNNVKEVMAPDSVLLIDETVLPEKGVGYIAASIDLTMMGAFASQERTEREWRELIESVGLELASVSEYSAFDHECILDIRLPRATEL